MTRVTIMIATKNRLDDLRRTLNHVSKLTPSPDEILVTADGCSDGTIEFIQKYYPAIRLTVNEESLGSVQSRATMMEQSSCDIVLALDDDSYPENKNCLPIICKLFENDDSLAIATFPQRTDEYPDTITQTDFGEKRPTKSFPNSGAAIRVSSYRQLPGFEPIFFHMYEEPDYALQCIGNGWKVELFPHVTIRHHWTSQQRSQVRNHHRHARNEFWSTVIRCPFPQLIFICGYRCLSQMSFSLRYGGLSWLIREPAWWFQAAAGLPQAIKRRSPLTWAGYRKWLRTPDQ